MTNHVIQPNTLQFSGALWLSSQPLVCLWRAAALCLRVQAGARSRGAAGGGIESSPEKINNALVCKWPVLTPRLSRRLELLWPLDRSRQVVSGRNTFPQMTSLQRESEAQSEPGTKAQYSIKTWDHILIFFFFSLSLLLTSFAAWLYLREHSVSSQLHLWPIRTLIRPLRVHEEWSFNLHLLAFERHENMTLIPQSGNAQTVQSSV